MLKQITQVELERLSPLILNNINYLIKHCPGILTNEMKAQYVNGDDSKNQQNIKMQLEMLEKNVVVNLNDAIDKGNAEKLRFELTRFYTALEQIFNACLSVRDAKDIPEQRDIGQVKGHYLQVLQELIVQCKKAKEFVNQDRHIKSAQVKVNKLAEEVSKTIRALGTLLGVKAEKTKDEKIINLVARQATTPSVNERTLPKKRH